VQSRLQEGFETWQEWSTRELQSRKEESFEHSARRTAVELLMQREWRWEFLGLTYIFEEWVQFTYHSMRVRLWPLFLKKFKVITLYLDDT